MYLAALMVLELLTASAATDAAAKWRAVFEGQPGIVAVAPISTDLGVDLAKPLWDCPGLVPLKVDAVAAFNLKIDLGKGRRTDLDILIGELPPGVRADQAVIAAGGGKGSSDWSCVVTKRGVSFLQIGRNWIGLPTLCRKGYYQGAVSAVLAALHHAWADDFPTQFIYAPCGTMTVRATGTDGFLRKSASPSNKPLQTDGASRRR